MALSESLATNNPTYRVWLSKLFLIVLPTRRFGAFWGGEILAEGYCGPRWRLGTEETQMRESGGTNEGGWRIK